MNKILGFAAIIGSLALGGLTANALSNDYICKKRANSVCAMKISTGQCTHTWKYSEGGNPMYACQKAIGNDVGNNYDPSNYYCRNFGSRACAVDSRTGQCTNSWSRDNTRDPMFDCEKFLGHGNGRVDKSNYVCSRTATGYCARNLRTGQCTHHWKYSESPDPKFKCEKYLGSN